MPHLLLRVLESRVCVHSVLCIAYLLKLCALKVTLLKSSRETENGCSGPYLQDVQDENRRLAMGGTREACGDGAVLYLDCGGD